VASNDNGSTANNGAVRNDDAPDGAHHRPSSLPAMQANAGRNAGHGYWEGPTLMPFTGTRREVLSDSPNFKRICSDGLAIIRQDANMTTLQSCLAVEEAVRNLPRYGAKLVVTLCDPSAFDECVAHQGDPLNELRTSALTGALASEQRVRDTVQHCNLTGVLAAKAILGPTDKLPAVLQRAINTALARFRTPPRLSWAAQTTLRLLSAISISEFPNASIAGLRAMIAHGRVRAMLDPRAAI